MADLYIRELGAPPSEATERCLIVHGIMGSSQNWLGAARKLTQRFPDWSIQLLDLPGHGQSSVSDTAPRLPDITQRISQQLARDHWQPTILMGHSFGGKTMIELSKRYSETPLTLWLLDAPMNAGTLVTGTQTIETILSVVERLPRPEQRQSVTDALVDAGLSMGIAQWMNTNLKRTESGFEWKISPEFIRAALSDYLEREYWDYLTTRPDHHVLNCVLAGKATWWRGEVERSLRRLPNSRLHVLQRAGHWVHIDDLAGLVQCFDTVHQLGSRTGSST
ncbi:MAG: alpha/beta fold hydrolase [Bradymonadia bacterium]